MADDAPKHRRPHPEGESLMEPSNSGTFSECVADAERARAVAKRAWDETRRYLAAFTAVPRIGPGMPVATQYLVFRNELKVLQKRHGGRASFRETES
jgi:hypothetical protein